MSTDQINEYYNNNIEKINSMYIYSSDDLYLIAQQSKNIFKDNYAEYYYVAIDQNSLKYEGEYCAFNLNIRYTDNQIINLKLYLSNNKTNNENIKLQDNSKIRRLYELSNEGFNKANAIEIIENIMSNVEDIKNDTLTYSINKERQYYDLHKEKLNNIGIYSADDFEQFITSVGNISWDSRDSITGYSIDISNPIKDENYTTVKLYINYGNIERIELNMSVSNKINIVPQIKIS